MQSSSRGFAASGQMRRAPGPGPGSMYQQANHQAQVPAANQTAHVQHQQDEMRRREAQRRQARKPTDLDIDDDLSEAVITDAAVLYRKLRDQEKRLDAIMTKKRLDILEGTSGQMPSEGVLRLFISNTAEAQPWQMANDGNAGFNEDGTFDFADNQARYRVKIEGKLLEGSDDVDEDSELKAGLPAMAPIKMSHFFKRVTVDFDRPAALQADAVNKVEWVKKEGEGDVDCIAFGRKSDEEVQVTINLYLDEQPERFKLSPRLGWLLDMDTATRAEVVQGIWDYARLFKLIDPDDERRINCDEHLKQIFRGIDPILFPMLPEIMHDHLSPLDPIKLPYTIRVDKDYIAPEDDDVPPSNYMVWDVRVKVPSTTKRLMQAIISSPRHMANLKKITQINDDTALLLEKARHLNSKRKFLLSLSRDPATFIKRWTSSQQRDLEIILAEAGRGFGDEGHAGEEFRRGGMNGPWGTNLAREAVGLHLARQKNH